MVQAFILNYKICRKKMIHSKKIQQVVFLCGGLGTRLMPLTETVPKPLVECNNKPFIEYLIEQFVDQGIYNFLMLTGYLGDKIIDRLGDGCQFGAKIEYHNGPVHWNTSRRLWEARKLISSEIYLMYSDNFALIKLDELKKINESENKILTLSLMKKSPGNICLDNKNQPMSYNPKRSTSSPYVEIGYMYLRFNQIVNKLKDNNLEFSTVISSLVKEGQVNAILNNGVYYSISDPPRLLTTEKYLKSKKIILLDRDGVINEKAPEWDYVKNLKEFTWIEKSKKSLIKLAKDGYEFIIITNQAGIARKKILKKDLQEIHDYIFNQLKDVGVNIIDTYVCPHNWHDNCFCRKPEPGLLLQASKEHFFRLDKTIFVGDKKSDIEAAKRAGSKGLLFDKNNDDLYELISSNIESK